MGYLQCRMVQKSLHKSKCDRQDGLSHSGTPVIMRYEVSDPPVPMDGLHDPSDIGQGGFRNPLGGGPIFVSFTNMGLVLLLGVLCS